MDQRNPITHHGPCTSLQAKAEEVEAGPSPSIVFLEASLAGVSNHHGKGLYLVSEL